MKICLFTLNYNLKPSHLSTSWLVLPGEVFLAQLRVAEPTSAKLLQVVTSNKRRKHHRIACFELIFAEHTFSAKIIFTTDCNSSTLKVNRWKIVEPLQKVRT